MAPALSRAAWAAAAALALAALLWLALRSPDRQQSLADYQAAGTMRHIAVEQVRRVTLITPTGSRQYARGTDGTWAHDGRQVPATTGEALDAGLRLLHNTPPERDFDSESPDFGLQPPALRVQVQATEGRAFEAEIGALNPMGLARYVRIRSPDHTALQLLPAYLADAWAPALAPAP